MYLVMRYSKSEYLAKLKPNKFTVKINCQYYI